VVRGTAQINPHRWTYSVRLLANQIDRATWRNTLMYRLNEDIQVGVEYNPLAGDVGPLANWRLVRETKTGPAVIVGTSSDRIGTPRGRSYYVTVSKEVAHRLSLYAGTSYSEFEKRFLVPAGVTYRVDDRWSVLVSYDGVAVHPMATYAWDRYSVTLLMVRGRDPGINFSVGF
jgi:hypothetical protein